MKTVFVKRGWKSYGKARWMVGIFGLIYVYLTVTADDLLSLVIWLGFGVLYAAMVLSSLNKTGRNAYTIEAMQDQDYLLTTVGDVLVLVPNKDYGGFMLARNVAEQEVEQIANPLTPPQ